MKRKYRKEQFDIHEDIIPFLGMPDERKVKRYIKNLNKAFARSPEGKAVKQATDDRNLSWVKMFVEFAILNHGFTPPYIYDRLLREILYEDIPESVIVEPKEAPNIIAQIKAFWEFIEREYQLQTAKLCLKVLNQKNIVKRLEEKMADRNLYSTVKLIAMQAIDQGVDITSNKEMSKFIEEYNAKIEAGDNPLQATISPELQQKAGKIKALAAQICTDHLNDEYRVLAQKLADAVLTLPVPLFAKGREKSWAAGVVYALAQVNFLFDPANEPYMTATDLAKAAGVSQQTASSKAREISDAFGLSYFHPDWTLPSMMGEGSTFDSIQRLLGSLPNLDDAAPGTLSGKLPQNDADVT